jgi:integrase
MLGGTPYGDAFYRKVKCVTLWRTPTRQAISVRFVRHYRGHFSRNGGNNMAKRGKGNALKYQVTVALQKIHYHGVSKKDLRDRGKETGIHSTTQMKHALSYCQNFAKWLKEQGVRDLFQLKRSHYRDYIAYLQGKGVSNGHLINVETNLRLLAKGMAKISADKGMKERDWVPKQRLISTDLREKPKDRSYTPQEVELLKAHMSDNARIGLELQMAFGLRLREAALTRVAHIEERNGRLFWIAVKDREALNTAHGVTKAGRPRITPCRPEYEARIRELIRDKLKHAYVSPVKYNSLKSAYLRAAEKAGIAYAGSHGFRHTYARESLMAMLKQKGIGEKGKEMIQRMLNNHSNGLRKDYGVSRDERELYKTVNECIDTVHEWLGHGRGRIDLCEVYMK